MRTRYRAAVGLLMPLILLAIGLTFLIDGDPQTKRSVSHVGVRRLGPTDARRSIDFSLGLRMRDRGMDRYVRAVNDPTSPSFRRFISLRQMGRRFGPPRRQLRRLRRALHHAGMRITSTYPQRTEVEVRGAAGAVERFFHTTLLEYRDAHGRRYRVPLRRPHVPAALAGTVRGVTGLDTRGRLQPAAVPLDGLLPRDVVAAYNVSPLRRVRLQGRGQTVAIVSFDTFDPDDVTAFDRRAGIRHAPQVKRVPVNGGVSRPGEGQAEVNLYIDVLRGVAPKAQILNYEAPNRFSNFAPVINRIVSDGRADVISISWGKCEKYFRDKDSARALQDGVTAALRSAAGKGINVFVASGDDGAYDCQSVLDDRSDLSPAVDFPASSPYAIAVGGTMLSVRKNSSYLAESGWEDVLSGGGGGGGMSQTQLRPEWQRGAGVPKHTLRRLVPDVAATASPFSGFLVYTGGKDPPEFEKAGGTSAAAPFWAGSMTLVGELARREHAGPLPFLSDLFYRFARRRVSPFHDIVRGGNRLYDAGPGWDYATGLGSPDVGRLSADIIAALRR
jgi:subtilase family serine protease